MKEETLYSAPVCRSEQEQEEPGEKELLAIIESEDAMSSDTYPLYLLMLGKLYLSGKTSEGKPDYILAVKYLEQGLALAPLQGKEYAGLLGTACEARGKKIDAIHWYRAAVEEFGQEQYRGPLYRLYLTGLAGAAKKREAEERML